ncbi:MAG: lytic murein transglycosylase [Alphaproteobacteria bacterium]|nr:lytic murein transglycosylase [Alphaproteobacteria bacterium]
MLRRIFLQSATAAGILSMAPRVMAAAADFASWLRDLEREAAERGISGRTLASALTGVSPIARILELDRRQPEVTLTFEQYLTRVVPDRRVQAGQERLARNRPLLDEISGRYGVQARFIVALWGIESDFGRITGSYPVIGALATLAYDGRRSAFFRRELLEALAIIDQGHITAERMIGSWAGAMGQSQFMPSSFRAYAVDHDGDGRRDIWSSKPDVFASTANYLRQSGWKSDETWGRPVRVPGGLNLPVGNLGAAQPLGDWQAQGVRATDGRDLPSRDISGSLLVPGAGAPPFLVYDNYRTILKWNRSHFFAIAVGTLADRIEGS